MATDCTCACCTSARALSAFVGGGLLSAWIAEKFADKGSDWPIYIAVAGGLAMMFLLRYLDRRERRKKTA